MQLDGFVFFLLAIGIGYLLCKLKLIPLSAADVLPSVLLNVFFPAMLLNTFANANAEELLSAGLPTVLCTLIFSLLPFFACFFLLRKADRDKRALLRYIAGVGNTSFVCIPLMSLFLSDSQMLIVFVHGAVMDFLIWGVHHQIFVGSGEKNFRLILKKVFASPCLIAVLLGIFLAALKVELPGFLQYTLDALEAAVSPLALVFIGVLIARYGIFAWCKSPTAIFYSIWKVLLLPCIVFASLYFILPLETVLILTFLFGSPAPISAVLWCKEYGKEAKLAVDCLIPSTLLYFLVMGSALAALTHCGILG